MKRQARHTERDRLVIRADDLTSRIVIAQDPACVTCGSVKRPTCGHLFGRTNHSTRWDTQTRGNCHRQCWPCNSAHNDDKTTYQNWYVEKFGQPEFDALEFRWRRVRKFSDVELRCVVMNLEMRAMELGLRVRRARATPDVSTHGLRPKRAPASPRRGIRTAGSTWLNRSRFRTQKDLGNLVANCNDDGALTTTRTKRPFTQRSKQMNKITTKAKTNATTEKANRELRNKTMAQLKKAGRELAKNESLTPPDPKKVNNATVKKVISVSGTKLATPIYRTIAEPEASKVEQSTAKARVKKTAAKRARHSGGIPAWKQDVIARPSVQEILEKIKSSKKAITEKSLGYRARWAKLLASVGLVKMERRDDETLVFLGK